MNYTNINILFCLLAAILSPHIATPQSSRQQRPNIVLILADDMGYSDLGCFGSEISTPHLDKLAAEGIKMTQFYNAGRCCPSRAALLTGQYPHKAGVGDMLQDDELPGYSTHLNFTSVTIAEVLKGAGYHTIISGKWHVGNDSAYWPTQRGFDDQFFSNGTTGHYFGISKGRQFIVQGKLVEPPGEWFRSDKNEYKLLKNKDGSQWYATDAIADNAISFVTAFRRDNSTSPFFMYLPFTAPHWPLHAFESDIKKYESKYKDGWDVLKEQRYKRMMQLGIIDPQWKLSGRNENVKEWSTLPDSTKKYYSRLMAVYAAMIDRLDQNIGKVTESLRQSGELDNTVIIFLSDNGGCHEIVHKGDKKALTGTPDSYDGYEYGWASASNTPFQWFKHWSHEGGISTPFIAWYPSMIRSGTVSREIGYIADILPTIADLAGAEYPKLYKGHTIQPVTGKSLLPLWKGQTFRGHDYIVWEHEGNRAVRKGDLKLVSRFDYTDNKELPWELYDLKKDRSETNNLATHQPEKVRALENIYRQWSGEVKAVPYNQILDARKRKNPSKSE